MLGSHRSTQGGSIVTETLLLAYLVAGVVTASAAWLLGKRLRHDRRPAEHPASVSIVAGLLWPLLLLGVIELGSLALLKSFISSKPGVAINA
jgi:hypothetical protein